MKRFLVAFLAATVALILVSSIGAVRRAEAQAQDTVATSFVNGFTTCSSTRSTVAPASVSTRNFATYNLSASRCYFGGATVTTANGTALCTVAAPTCISASQSWNVGNASKEYMIAAVGTSISIGWDGAGY